MHQALFSIRCLRCQYWLAINGTDQRQAESQSPP